MKKRSANDPYELSYITSNNPSNTNSTYQLHEKVVPSFYSSYSSAEFALSPDDRLPKPIKLVESTQLSQISKRDNAEGGLTPQSGLTPIHDRTPKNRGLDDLEIEIDEAKLNNLSQRIQACLISSRNTLETTLKVLSERKNPTLESLTKLTSLVVSTSNLTETQSPPKSSPNKKTTTSTQKLNERPNSPSRFQENSRSKEGSNLLSTEKKSPKMPTAQQNARKKDLKIASESSGFHEYDNTEKIGQEEGANTFNFKGSFSPVDERAWERKGPTVSKAQGTPDSHKKMIKTVSSPLSMKKSPQSLRKSPARKGTTTSKPVGSAKENKGKIPAHQAALLKWVDHAREEGKDRTHQEADKSSGLREYDDSYPQDDSDNEQSKSIEVYNPNKDELQRSLQIKYYKSAQDRLLTDPTR